MGRHIHSDFDPTPHEPQLRAVIEELAPLETISHRSLIKAIHRHPKAPGRAFCKGELIAGARHFAQSWQLDAESFVRKLRLKPGRTGSGVAPVTVMTAEHPCPGNCIFCPTEPELPKSYLSREPSAQRAQEHDFDPYGQTNARLRQFHLNGHPTDKVELNIVGGTWSAYPESYRIWFVKRCFDGLNDFRPQVGEVKPRLTPSQERPRGSAEWSELVPAQQDNEQAESRCVGLAVELRPDSVTVAELESLRRLGATKVQLGVQSLDDSVLELNRRGHDVAATRRAMKLLRQGGFKIHAHIMSNLYGTDPAQDVACVEQLFADPSLRPDELKLYPCSLLEQTELMDHYREGRFRPYGLAELTGLLAQSLALVPPYCRVNRMMRDIPASYIVEGVTKSNLREDVEAELSRRGQPSRDIRSREIRAEPVDPDALLRDELRYDTGIGEEVFVQYVTEHDRLVGFLRLALPTAAPPLEELRESALIREVHVYGNLARFGAHPPGAKQHLGLGTQLIERACQLAAEAGFAHLAVISAVGTRAYYRRLGFEDGTLYQRRPLESSAAEVGKQE